MPNPGSDRFTSGRLIMGGLATLVLMLGFGAGAFAQLSELNPAPFGHSPCGVFREGPCTPQVCGVYDSAPCIPEMDYPYGQNLQLTIQSDPDDKDIAKYQKPDHELGTIGDLFAALRACWAPPALSEAHHGMQMSVMFSFRRDGGLIAPPRMTFATKDVSAQTRDVYLGGIRDALATCAPLQLSSGLGGAIAGRPILIRYVDNRRIGE